MIQLGVYRVSPEVRMPKYNDDFSACFDLYFCPTENNIHGYTRHGAPFTKPLNLDKSITIHPGDRLRIPTGLIFKLRVVHSVETFADITREKEELRQFSIRLHSDHSLALTKGITLVISEGIVDVDNQNEVYVLMTNTSDSSMTINYHDRICQGEVVVNELVNIVEISDTPRSYSEKITSKLSDTVIHARDLSVKDLASTIEDLEG